MWLTIPGMVSLDLEAGIDQGFYLRMHPFFLAFQFVEF
jgi:hypothetical protein